MVISCGFVIINTNNKILICHPTNDFSGYGIWDLPKGRIDDGETELECALREVYEETNLNLKEIKGDTSFLSRTERNGRKYVLYVFRALEDLSKYEIKCNSLVDGDYESWETPYYEIDEYKWVSVYDSLNYLCEREQTIIEKKFIRIK
jgi:8-oxo-dGTP pyrophosphatase MutT (NUDIX family)